MNLASIMNTHPKTVRSTDTLLFARNMMLWSDCRSLPVVDDGHFVGLISELDIARYQARIGESIASNPTDEVARAMNENPDTAHGEDSVTEATARMAEGKLLCLPIVEKKKLLGIVTSTDILRYQVQKAMKPSEGGTRIGEVMTPEPYTIHPDDSLIDAAARMRAHRIRHLPVIDGESRVVGMLSDRDVRGAIGYPGEKELAMLEHLKVHQAMSRPVITVWPEQSCDDAARAFSKLSASAVPVVRRDNGTLVGMLSYIDLLRPASNEN